MLARNLTRAPYRLALMATAAAVVGLGATASRAGPISGAGTTYNQSDVGTTVTPDFQGGTLRDNQNNVTDTHGYTVENYPTNTIDAFGNTTTFAGIFSGAGPVTITDSAGGGVVILTGANTYGGATTIGGGARLALSGAGSAANSAITNNGEFDVTPIGDTVSVASLSGAGKVVVSSYQLVLTHASGPFSGVASGGGGFQIFGGTETFSGVNTYTGPTYIASGAGLNLVGGGSIATSDVVFTAGAFDISGASGDVSLQRFAGSGQVILGSNTLVLTAPQDEFAGAITGAGGLTIAAGKATLDGENTFTGPATIASGATLQIGAGGVAGSVASNIVDNGALIFDRSNDLTYAQVISGPGSVSILGAGPVTFTADQTSTGPTSIAAGSNLRLGNGGAAGSLASAIVNDDGLLTFNRSAALTWAGTIQGAGAATIAGTGPITFTGANTYAGATTVNAGATLNLGAGGATGSVAGAIADNGVLNLNHGGALVLSQGISGSGALNQVGTGTTVLNAVNPFSGPTTVSAGALEVGDGSHPGASLAGNVIVGAAGTLMGHGTVAGSVANNGVTAPGGTIGTLTVGSYAQGPGGTLNIEVSPTAASLLNALGAASLDGKLALTVDPGTYGAQIYEIVAGRPVTGTFSSVSGSFGPGIVSAVIYARTEVDLVTEATSGAQVYGGLSAATLDRAENLVSLVEDRFGDAGCADGSPGTTASACNGYGAWALAVGSWNHQGADGGAFGFRNDGVGVVGGLDRSSPNGSRVGVAFGYAHNDLSMDAVAAKASGPSYFGAIYGRLVEKGVWLDGEAFYMHTDWTVNRTVPGFGVATAVPNAKSEGFLLQASAPIGAAGLRPYARFTYAHLSRDAATEQGVGQLGFLIASAGQNAAVGEAGLLYEATFATSGGVALRPAIQLGVQDNFGDRHQTISGSLAGLPGTTFDEIGPRLWGVAAVVDGSLKVRVSQGVELFGDLRGRFGDHKTDGVVSAGGVFRF